MRFVREYYAGEMEARVRGMTSHLLRGRPWGEGIGELGLKRKGTREYWEVWGRLVGHLWEKGGVWGNVERLWGSWGAIKVGEAGRNWNW